MDFRKLNLSDKPLFDRHLGELQSRVSELTFTNLFMWKDFYGLRYAEIAGLLCLISVRESAEPFALMPIGAVDGQAFGEALSRLKKYFGENGWTLKFQRVEERDLGWFKPYLASGEDAVFDRDNSDYVYAAKDLIELKGKKFDGKRNHINKFKKLYTGEYVKIDPVSPDETLIDECIRIMDEWFLEKDPEIDLEKDHERKANLELLRNFKQLGCSGALVRVDGRFEAFTVGEMLNADTAVIHIEKANGKINGLYTYINQQFCQHEWHQAQYINREQDLGLEGLRKAKLSYNPVEMVNKYTVVVR